MNYGKRKLPPAMYQSSLGSSHGADVGSSSDPLKDETVKRKFRNLNEKKRRDQFNMLINELSAIVCSADSRRIDKITVLEQAIQFLENHKESELNLNENVVSYSWKPSFLSHEEFMYLMLEAMDCVTLALDELGTIKLLSDNAHQKLGLAQEVVNQARRLDEFLGDSSILDTLLTTSREQPNRLFEVEALVSSDPYSETGAKFLAIDLLYVPDGDSNPRPTQPNHTQEPSLLLNCIMQLKTPSLSKESYGPEEMSFKGKYSLEWKVLFMENKASNVLGYQPFEILGTSGYDYYHPADLDHISMSHRKVLKTGCCRTSLHRMLTKSQDWVWLRTDLYMCYNQWNGKPEHIECIHRIPRKEEIVEYKRNGCSPESVDPVPAVKRPRMHESFTSPTASSFGKTTELPLRIQVPKSDMFSSILSEGINRNRELAHGRQAPQQLLKKVPYTPAPAKPADPPLLSPINLNPVQAKLHLQLRTKYNALKASLDRQQEELANLLTQLNLAATMQAGGPDQRMGPNTPGSTSDVNYQNMQHSGRHHMDHSMSYSGHNQPQ